jgi:hypothetical protein
VLCDLLHCIFGVIDGGLAFVFVVCSVGFSFSEGIYQSSILVNAYLVQVFVPMHLCTSHSEYVIYT